MADLDYSQRTVGIIGAGAAGMMAAIYAAQNGADVTLFEKNSYLGRKLGITGKGRCNVTNDCDNQEFLKNVIANPKFLYASINNFSTSDTKSFFENLGVPLKTERGRRVFPVSDKAADIVNALKNCIFDMGVKVVHEKVTAIITNGDTVTGLKTEYKDYSFDAVICATGGASYPMTGSDGDGYRFAKSLGIGVTDIFPSLVPLETKENVACLMGLSLKNVTLKVVDNKTGKVVFNELGEMLFTHFGLTGPLVLSASSHMREMSSGRYKA
ncbi:MAG: aminoacetone oxidase family FAD-binding enzyme, partial [Clostridia bacterium]|nr:aminoacetone oxidase family FAD-binding enzyme [Clostridia bacterium]